MVAAGASSSRGVVLDTALRSLSAVFCGPVGASVADEQAEHNEPAEPVVEYRPKPPLWHSPERPASGWAWILGVILALLTVAALTLSLEPYVLSAPMGQMTVTIVRIEAGGPADERPASYHYRVQLPDQSMGRLICERILPPGAKLVVTASRGRITGRVRLGAPYRVMLPTEVP